MLASGLYLLTISAGGGLLIFRECSGSTQRLFSSLSLSTHLYFYSCTSIRTQAGSVRGVEAAAIHPSPTKPGPHEIRGRDNKATTQGYSGTAFSYIDDLLVERKYLFLRQAGTVNWKVETLGFTGPASANANTIECRWISGSGPGQIPTAICWRILCKTSADSGHARIRYLSLSIVSIFLYIS